MCSQESRWAEGVTTIEFKQPTSLTDREVAHIAAKYRAFDLGSLLLLAALVVVALFTFRDYAISNDEGVQHHYGELSSPIMRAALPICPSSTFRTSISMAGCLTSLRSRSAI